MLFVLNDKNYNGVLINVHNDITLIQLSFYIMKKISILLALCILFSSHDMFLKFNSYFLEPHSKSTVQLINGTFDRSDNTITRDRMIDVSVVENGNRAKIDTTEWFDEGETSILNLGTNDPGTYVVGVSTKARDFAMKAKTFNDYLIHDGVLDMLEMRKQKNMIDQDVVEKYSKHVKAIFQVGNEATNDWSTILDYPIEFVPLQNPYKAKLRDEFRVQLLWAGKPLINQLVYAGNAKTSHTHDDDEDHHHHDIQLRTDENGIISFKPKYAGIWFLRTIYMEESSEPGLTHESNWATLTFEMPSRSQRLKDANEEEKGEGLFTTGKWLLIISLTAILLLLILRFLMRRKKN